ncbi:hypothetical protein C5167_018910 [Papaver somniferum]|uniref:Uncharacterized protein n=1 Tax=Papaver somniferum TaxID=3469 RepID=A0A4Y7IQR7_PAPSO|nr:hypothetical protein C5167_018910 [Papaver somniferum]
MKLLKLEKRFEDLGMAEVTESHHPVKGADNSDDNNTGWIRMPLGEASESFRNLGSMDSSILSMSGPWSSLIPVRSRRCLLEWHSVTMVHLEGEVCAKGFEALRRTSELDFVRSLNLRVGGLD